MTADSGEAKGRPQRCRTGNAPSTDTRVHNPPLNRDQSHRHLISEEKSCRPVLRHQAATWHSVTGPRHGQEPRVPQNSLNAYLAVSLLATTVVSPRAIARVALPDTRGPILRDGNLDTIAASAIIYSLILKPDTEIATTQNKAHQQQSPAVNQALPLLVANESMHLCFQFQKARFSISKSKVFNFKKQEFKQHSAV